MKRAVTVILVALFIFPLSLPGSEAAIKEIRERYNAVSEDIEHEDLLHHEIAFRTLVPGIGFQHTTMRFYYEFLQDGETGEILESPLIKLTFDYMIAASVHLYGEYLFDEGEHVIFYYHRAEGYECGEERVYFEEEKLIKVKTNPLGEECIESDAGYIYPAYEKAEDFSAEDHAKAKKIVKKAHTYVSFFDEMQAIEQLDK